MQAEQVFFAITLDNGQTAVMGFFTVQRGPRLPSEALWLDEDAGWWRREPVDAAVFGEIARAFTTGPQPVRYRRLQPGELPADRTFRDALTDNGSKLGYDMARARALHLRRLRVARAPKLDQLDRDWMRATGQGDKKEADRVEAERQRLRDLPATLGVESATTIDELKALGLGTEE